MNGEQLLVWQFEQLAFIKEPMKGLKMVRLGALEKRKGCNAFPFQVKHRPRVGNQKGNRGG